MNAIAKAAFEHARELAKLPTVEQIREIVHPGETHVDSLIARVDNTLAIYADRIPKDYPDAALFLADAKLHLCDPSTKKKHDDFFKTEGFPPMDSGDVQAWFVLNDVQQHLWEAKDTCQLPVECGQNAYPCGKTSRLFCADCGEDICDEHSERVGQVTYCEGCAGFVKLVN